MRANFSSDCCPLVRLDGIKARKGTRQHPVCNVDNYNVAEVDDFDLSWTERVVRTIIST